MPLPNSSVNFDYIRTRLKSIALSSYYSYDPHQLPLNISKAELSALNKLCRNKDLIISCPDKGNGVVILDRQDYVRKVTSILEDTTKFLPLDSDMLEICQKRENRLLRFLRDSLLKGKLISDFVYHDLFPTGSTPGILYGLPKVHIFAMYLLHVVYHYIFQCSLYILFFRIFPIRPYSHHVVFDPLLLYISVSSSILILKMTRARVETFMVTPD